MGQNFADWSSLSCISSVSMATFFVFTSERKSSTYALILASWVSVVAGAALPCDSLAADCVLVWVKTVGAYISNAAIPAAGIHRIAFIGVVLLFTLFSYREHLIR